MKRQFDPTTPEWMDLPQPRSQELDDDLANLRTLNRIFGGIHAVLAPLTKILTPSQSWKILDLATGSADIPLAIAGWCAERDISMTVDAVDFQPATLEVATETCAAHPNIRFHQADIRSFLPDERWDIVICSLALHHFSEPDAVKILRNSAILAQRCAIVSDLRRSTLGTAGVDLLTALWMRAPMTRNDARASVRRAFSFAEFRDLALAAGWRGFAHRKARSFRQTLVLEKFKIGSLRNQKDTA